MARALLNIFNLANPIYRGATVTAWTVAGGVKTATKQTLYVAEAGTDTLANPQQLDSEGRFRQPVYVEAETILTISGMTIPDHDTGIVAMSAASTAAGVTFLQTGTGAVSRTVQSKLQEHLSVLDFGADPTGVASAVSAFQALINSTTNGTSQVFIVPRGTYAGNLATLTYGTRTVAWVEEGGVTYSGTAPTGRVSLLDFTVTFLQAGTGAISRTLNDKMKDIISVFDFMSAAQIADVRARTVGQDVTAAVQSAVDAVGANASLYFPPGKYKITSTVTVSDHRVHLIGAGGHATMLYFSPQANDVMLDINAAGAVIFQGSVRDMALFSDGSAFTKTALKLTDSSGYVLDNIVLGGDYVVPGVGNFWGGNNSIGLEIRGREFGLVRNIYCYADRPLVILTNPNNSISIDHFHFQDCYLTANGNPNVEIGDGVNLTQVTFDGAQPWVLGTAGLRWIDTTTTGASNGLTLRGVRTEQGTDAASYNVDIQHNYGLQNLVIDGCSFEGGRHGFRFRKCDDVYLGHSYYVGTAGKVALSTDATVRRLVLDGMFWQSGSSATLTGQQALLSTPTFGGAAIPPNAIYDSTGAKTLTINAAISEATITVANDAVAEAAAANTGGMLFVQDSEGYGAIFGLRGSQNALYEVADPGTVYSVTADNAATTNVYWSAGNGRYEIQNKRGASRNYKLFVIGAKSTF